MRLQKALQPGTYFNDSCFC